MRTCAAASGALVLLVVGFLLIESRSAWRHIGVTAFLRDADWRPTPNAEEGSFGLLPMLVGSLCAMVGAVGLAAPLGIGSALFGRYYAPRGVAAIYRRILELLSGIPSVVYGFWGLIVVVPLVGRWQPPGASLLAGILVLALMVMPTMALVADRAFASVPRSYHQAAAALGLSRWTTVSRVVLPAAKSGLLTGGILQAGRALGETMAVLMVCGNVVQWPDSVFAPIRTLTANIALEMAYATGDHRGALFATGVALMLLVGGLVLTAAWTEHASSDG